MMDCWSSLVVFACSLFGASYLLVGLVLLVAASYFVAKAIPEGVYAALAVITVDLDLLTGIFFAVAFFAAAALLFVLVLLWPIPAFGALACYVQSKCDKTRIKQAIDVVDPGNIMLD